MAGRYPFVPFDPALFVALLQGAWRVLAAEGRAAGARFLDVGAGAGTKLLIAERIFPRADGLEIDSGHLARSACVTDRLAPGNRLIAGDALRFEGYGDYDVIYWCAPLREPEALAAMEGRILDTARPGTVLIAPFVMPSLVCRLPQIAHRMVVVGRDEAGLAALRAEAERVGTTVPPVEPRAIRDPADLCAGAAEALRWAGFLPLANV